MPTPVSAARQCLTEEAARVLDDAVAVARRRSHAQTTSLHAVSALLALPSSTLREACTRARSCSYSPRLQFRALELSVGVSLDRLPTTKAVEEDPPVSNSLMAAIKRSQANQRRHPDNFRLFQMHSQQQPAASLLKVELKHFVLSILDDPIVSRVFGEASFRSWDIKLALLQPPATQPSRFSRSPCPTIFFCNLPASDTVRPGFSFPFLGTFERQGVDDNCRRIGEVLVRKTKRNPLLVGIYARSALRSFIESIQNGREGVLPAGIAGLTIFCIEKEISVVLAGGGSLEKVALKFKELSRSLEQCSGPGIAVNFGELEGFVGNDVPRNAASFVVSQLTSLLEVHGEKIWVVGVAGTSDTYSKFLALFPNIEKDWDLHLLTITSATPSMEGLYPKSSLMGSFVPFGGFFSSPSEFKNPLSCTNQSFTRCQTCNQKYEQEVADILKVAPTNLASDHSTSLPRSQKAIVDVEQGTDVAKTDEGKASLNSTILGLQQKWSDFCERVHHIRSLPDFGTSQSRSQVPILGSIQISSGLKESSSKNPSPNENPNSSERPHMLKALQNIIPSKDVSPADIDSVSTGSDQLVEVSSSKQTDLQSPLIGPSSMANASMLDGRSSSSLVSVTTDLGLGTIYTSASEEPNTQKLKNHEEHLQVLNVNSLDPFAGSYSCSGPSLEGKFNSVDFKSLNQLLTEQVGWQDEAICTIIRTLSLYRPGREQHCGSHVRDGSWFAFFGPDRFGKKKVASVLAKIIFGSTESLIYVDLNSPDRAYLSNSIFESHNSFCYDLLRRKTVVDYIAGELSKKPYSVVFLENVDKADFLVQNSLFQAIRTSKFPDSHGREISIHNAIFIVSSSVSKGSGTSLPEKDSIMFSEDRILEAKRYQMQLLLEHVSASENAKRSLGTNVTIAPRKGTSEQNFLNKRKLFEICDYKEQASTSKIHKQIQEASRSYLDLNMPLQEVEEDIDHNDHEGESLVQSSEAWLRDFCDQIDEKVTFKPFNFDVLAEKILKSISIQIQRKVGSEFLLEIDFEVMIQILAATWLSDKKNAVEDWIENVLGKSFNEAKQRYYLSSECVGKLVSCKGILVEKQAPGVYLPAGINMN